MKTLTTTLLPGQPTRRDHADELGAAAHTGSGGDGDESRTPVTIAVSTLINTVAHNTQLTSPSATSAVSTNASTEIYDTAEPHVLYLTHDDVTGSVVGRSGAGHNSTAGVPPTAFFKPAAARTQQLCVAIATCGEQAVTAPISITEGELLERLRHHVTIDGESYCVRYELDVDHRAVTGGADSLQHTSAPGDERVDSNDSNTSTV
ncbi:hypothetical protein [Halovenus sp. HT40]|uniref:hypothetical protein n=1 Tax=Halovenus sp. HT40 TaxID=3126691 RepID=UPI00300F6ADB